ncbi:polysaccharide deacetylase family protein [Bacteroidota bacterium]
MKKVLLFISGFLFALILGALAGAYWYSRSWEHSLFIKPLNYFPTSKKQIALTFDDGPSTSRTPKLLALLRKHNVKATFFLLGKNIEKHPEIAKQIFQEGHLLGNHAYSHKRLVFVSPDFIRAEIEKTDSLIQALGQKEVRYFRPPFTAKFIFLPWVLKQMDKTLVTGTYDPPAEYNLPYIADSISTQVIDHAAPGYIVYLHDGKNADSDAFIQAVDSIIVQLKSENFEFLRLDEIENSEK